MRCAEMVHSLSQRLMARYFAVLLATSGIVSAIVHPLPNLTDMTVDQRAAITLTCVIGGAIIWVLPWDRWPRAALLVIPPIGLGVKMWANLHGGLGPYSYSIHFVLDLRTWMGVALPSLDAPGLRAPPRRRLRHPPLPSAATRNRPRASRWSSRSAW